MTIGLKAQAWDAGSAVAQDKRCQFRPYQHCSARKLRRLEEAEEPAEYSIWNGPKVNEHGRSTHNNGRTECPVNVSDANEGSCLSVVLGRSTRRWLPSISACAASGRLELLIKATGSHRKFSLSSNASKLMDNGLNSLNRSGTPLFPLAFNSTFQLFGCIPLGEGDASTASEMNHRELAAQTRSPRASGSIRDTFACFSNS